MSQGFFEYYWLSVPRHLYNVATVPDFEARFTHQLILTEVRGVSSAVTSLTRQVDRMDERLGGVEQRLMNVERDVSEMKADVKFIEGALSEQSTDIDDHERRIKRLENQAAL